MPDSTTASYSRDAARGPLHTALHELEVVIPGIPRDGCHCNLVTEVALDALASTLDALDRVRALAERWVQRTPDVGDGLCGAAILAALDGGA